MPKVLEPHSDSNSMPRKGADHGAPSGGAAMDGFSKVDYPATGPAESNSDVPSTQNSIGGMGQHGTSIGAYKLQPETISPK